MYAVLFHVSQKRNAWSSQQREILYFSDVNKKSILFRTHLLTCLFESTSFYHTISLLFTTWPKLHCHTTTSLSPPPLSTLCCWSGGSSRRRELQIMYKSYDHSISSHPSFISFGPPVRRYIQLRRFRKQSIRLPTTAATAAVQFHCVLAAGPTVGLF